MTRDLTTVPLLGRGGELTSASVGENLRRIRNHLDERSNPTGGEDSIAAVQGGTQLTATVTASMSALGRDDTRVTHRLGRRPTRLVWYEASVPGALLFGFANGGQGTAGGNQTAWDDKAVYVRSDVTASFTFVVT